MLSLALQERPALPRVVVVSTLLDAKADIAEPPGEHVHDFYSLYFLASGTARVSLENTAFAMGSGDLLLLPPQAAHRFEPAPHSDLWVAGFYLDTFDGATIRIKQAGSNLEVPLSIALVRHARLRVPFHAAELEARRWRSYLALLRTRSLEPAGVRGLTASPVIALLCIDFMRLSAHAGPSTDVLASMLPYIETHFRFPISTLNVAVALGHAPEHLTTVVRRETGVAILGWLALRRMIAARELLALTTDSLAHVAEQVGYPDVNNFARHFRRLHKMTPGEWRALAFGKTLPGSPRKAGHVATFEAHWGR